MYLHIGKDFIINSKYIIAIFNIDYVKNTKEYKSLYKELDPPIWTHMFCVELESTNGSSSLGFLLSSQTLTLKYFRAPALTLCL